MMRFLFVMLLACAAGCSGSTADRDRTDEPESSGPSFGSEATSSVGQLTLAHAQQSLVNAGCVDVEVLSHTRIAEPEGMVLVVRTELCEEYEQLGRVVMLVASVGDEFVLSNTIHVLEDVSGEPSDDVEIVGLEVPQVRSGGPNVVVLRYRTPAGEEAGSWVERLLVGTFSIEALDLSLVLPLRFETRRGGGRLTGNGTAEVTDSDADGDLDVVLHLEATGEGCRQSSQCRNGQHQCDVTVPWQSGGYEAEWVGDDCLFLGQLEL